MDNGRLLVRNNIKMTTTQYDRCQKFYRFWGPDNAHVKERLSIYICLLIKEVPLFPTCTCISPPPLMPFLHTLKPHSNNILIS